MSNEISKKILDEMIDHSVSVIRLMENRQLPRSIVDQTTRSVTSIGANYAEAQEASSKRDFVNKIYISKKEAAETVYWLKVIERLCSSSLELSILQDKTQRFTMTLQKILNSTRAKSSQDKG
jgi:four helix bundle protein